MKAGQVTLLMVRYELVFDVYCEYLLWMTEMQIFYVRCLVDELPVDLWM